MLRYIRVPILAILAGVSFYLGALELSGVTRFNPVVPPAEFAAAEIAAATAGVYVSLRVINAALSAAQEVEVGASVGAQVGVQPLKVLEPVDDTVERVADVVFAVAAGAALVNVGLSPVAGLGLVVLGAGLTGLFFSSFGKSTAMIRPMALRATRLGAALGIILPLGFAVGVDLGERLTEARVAEAYAVLDAIEAEAAALIGSDIASGPDVTQGGATTEDNPRFLGRLGGGFAALAGGVGDAVATTERYFEAIGYFLREADALFTASLTIIGVFALRTLVLPVLLLWAGMTMLRRSIGA